MSSQCVWALQTLPRVSHAPAARAGLPPLCDTWPTACPAVPCWSHHAACDADASRSLTALWPTHSLRADRRRPRLGMELGGPAKSEVALLPWLPSIDAASTAREFGSGTLTKRGSLLGGPALLRVSPPAFSASGHSAWASLSGAGRARNAVQRPPPDLLPPPPLAAVAGLCVYLPDWHCQPPA